MMTEIVIDRLSGPPISTSDTVMGTPAGFSPLQAPVWVFVDAALMVIISESKDGG